MFGENAIEVRGASAAAPVRNFTLRNTVISGFGRAAVDLKFVDGFQISDFVLNNLGRSG